MKFNMVPLAKYGSLLYSTTEIVIGLQVYQFKTKVEYFPKLLYKLISIETVQLASSQNRLYFDVLFIKYVGNLDTLIKW